MGDAACGGIRPISGRGGPPGGMLRGGLGRLGGAANLGGGNIALSISGGLGGIPVSRGTEKYS